MIRIFATLGLSLLLLSGCGDQLVELPLDAGGIGEDGPGISRPFVVSTTPANAAADQALDKKPTATFSRPMDARTITASTFTVRQGGVLVSGTVTTSGNTATFKPDQPLGLALLYTATITTGAQDLAGAALAQDHVWTFTVGACSLATVALRSAGAFAVLGGSTVTSVGQTSITGDVGVSPGTAVVGFPPGTFVGAMHAGNATAATALADLTTAYNDAAGRTLCAVAVAGDLGGRTLAPGLYKSTSSLEVTSGDLTLDAGGDPDAIFIFQTASTLTTAAARQVILTGGAKASNVFWQVGTSATFGTTSSFSGTILADQAITMNTGASLAGRSLARIAVVALDDNAIGMPAL
jgi:Ice-binding-like/Bacterial Ig-like domain